MGSSSEDAYVTLLTSDGYLPGAMVLAHSLRDHGTRKKLAVMVTMDSISRSTIDELQSIYDHIIPVERITNRSPANLYIMNRPDLNSAFTKINLWSQTQYRRIVYVDADVVALRAPDELFNLEAPFAAAPDIGWPDCFNSGVMVLKPDMGDYYALLALAQRGISFDGADQGLLNMHFSNFHRISFAYNCTPSGNYQYVPAYRHFQSTISMVHFIGQDKPWTVGREFGDVPGVYQELLGRWWAEYDRHYRVPVGDTPFRGSLMTNNRQTAAAISGQAPPSTGTVQQYVAGEQHLPPGYPSTPAPTNQIQEPKVERSADANVRGRPQSPVTEDRRFSAPHMQWDPTKQAPPRDAKPEAADFPSYTYLMSSDKELWQPPKKYPEPPRDMWYQVPNKRPVERPKPIFPWEENQAPPTRVFAEDLVPSPPPEPESPPPLADDEFSVSPPRNDSPDTEGQTKEASQPAGAVSPPAAPFLEYRGANAWDFDEGITRYVRALQINRKAGAQHTRNISDISIISPLPVSLKQDRRESLILTDFPTDSERPSLPVTPAPVRRNTFWAPERDAEGNLPEAEGVPPQDRWDPQTQLEELRRNSLLFAPGPSQEDIETPQREFLKSSTELNKTTDGTGADQERDQGDVSQTVPSFTNTSTTITVNEDPKPDSSVLRAVNFNPTANGPTAQENVLSPSES